MRKERKAAARRTRHKCPMNMAAAASVTGATAGISAGPSPEHELETAGVPWDKADPSYEGSPVIQAEHLQTPEEAAESERRMLGRDQPGLAKTIIALNAGVILCAVAYVLFQSPNQFTTGGASGLSIVLASLIPGLSQRAALWAVNVTLVAAGLALLERKAILWSVVASLALSAYASLFTWLLPIAFPELDLTSSITGDLWLDLCCTVLLIAAGNAIAYNAGASTGGTEILVMVLARRTSLEVTHAVALVNVASAGMAVTLWGPRLGLYCVVGLLLQTFVVGGALDDLKRHKVCTIICRKPARLEEFIVRELGRTATVTCGYGAYSGREASVVMTVLTRAEALSLQKFLHNLDPEAFVTYVSTSEITGKGFRWV